MPEIKTRVPRYVFILLVLISHFIAVSVKADPGDIDIYQDDIIIVKASATLKNACQE